jgi:hypothetical protein
MTTAIPDARYNEYGAMGVNMSNTDAIKPMTGPVLPTDLIVVFNFAIKISCMNCIRL